MCKEWKFIQLDPLQPLREAAEAKRHSTGYLLLLLLLLHRILLLEGSSPEWEMHRLALVQLVIDVL